MNRSAVIGCGSLIAIGISFVCSNPYSSWTLLAWLLGLIAGLFAGLFIGVWVMKKD